VFLPRPDMATNAISFSLSFIQERMQPGRAANFHYPCVVGILKRKDSDGVNPFP
jgi:hypothetical protein